MDTVPVCRNCAGAEWVCEKHADRPWDGMSSDDSACGCGAGAPCPCCNPEMAAAGFVDRREKAIVKWLRSLDEHYSGWNDHDDHYDNGYNAAVAQIAADIETGKHWAALSQSPSLNGVGK